MTGGALDLAFAVSLAAVNGVAPEKVFQVIASGALGRAASSGGLAVQALGALCHFALSVGWAAVFAALALRRHALIRRPLLSACGFGLVVFLCMRLVVLPLSAYPRAVTFKPLPTVLDLLSHVFLFSLPIVVVVGRCLRAHRRGNSYTRGLAEQRGHWRSE